MPPEDTGGRLYHLRPRALPGQHSGGRLLNFPVTGLPIPTLAPVHVLPTRANDGELLLTSRVVLEYAWAAHQRLNGARRRISYRQVVSGADRGTAAELLVARCEARGLPDCEAWMETLQYRGRTVIEAYEPGLRFIPAPDGHDCDCTCEGGKEHAQWIEDPPQWRTVRVGALLVRVSRGAEVRVRLAPR